ncbi:MAG: hypothetical protein BGO67_08340 [Alphaproteobacteria bacterium 41-28]|nr:MAG: hypothetical protein BGO67_08340 [Alphaproteobacteria bacterium 41-28]
MKRHIFLAFSSLLFCFSETSADFLGEDRDEDTIYIYRKSSIKKDEIRNLIVPFAFGDVESLSINKNKKTMTLFQAGQDPIAIESIFQPSLPWDLSKNQLEQFISAHTFTLKQLSDDTCKVDMSVPGLGGGRKRTPEQRAIYRATMRKAYGAKLTPEEEKAYQAGKKARQAARQAKAAAAARAAASKPAPVRVVYVERSVGGHTPSVDSSTQDRGNQGSSGYSYGF